MDKPVLLCHPLGLPPPGFKRFYSALSGVRKMSPTCGSGFWYRKHKKGEGSVVEPFMGSSIELLTDGSMQRHGCQWRSPVRPTVIFRSSRKLTRNISSGSGGRSLSFLYGSAVCLEGFFLMQTSAATLEGPTAALRCHWALHVGLPIGIALLPPLVYQELHSVQFFRVPALSPLLSSLHFISFPLQCAASTFSRDHLGARFLRWEGALLSTSALALVEALTVERYRITISSCFSSASVRDDCSTLSPTTSFDKTRPFSQRHKQHISFFSLLSIKLLYLFMFFFTLFGGPPTLRTQSQSSLFFPKISPSAWIVAVAAPSLSRPLRVFFDASKRVPLPWCELLSRLQCGGTEKRPTTYLPAPALYPDTVYASSSLSKSRYHSIWNAPLSLLNDTRLCFNEGGEMPLTRPPTPSTTEQIPSPATPATASLSLATPGDDYSGHFVVLVDDGMVHAITSQGRVRWSKPINRNMLPLNDVWDRAPTTAGSSFTADRVPPSSINRTTPAPSGAEKKRTTTGMVISSDSASHNGSVNQTGNPSATNSGEAAAGRSTESSDTDAFRRFVPGSDGQIFYRGEDGVLMALPLHVRDVVFHSPFSTPLFPSIYFLGKREAVVEILDFETGEPAMRQSGGHQGDNDTPSSAPPSYNRDEHRTEGAPSGLLTGAQLRIGQTRWVVRAMDIITHREKWRLEWRELTPILNLGSHNQAHTSLEEQTPKHSSQHESAPGCPFPSQGQGPLVDGTSQSPFQSSPPTFHVASTSSPTPSSCANFQNPSFLDPKISSSEALLSLDTTNPLERWRSLQDRKDAPLLPSLVVNPSSSSAPVRGSDGTEGSFLPRSPQTSSIYEPDYRSFDTICSAPREAGISENRESTVTHPAVFFARRGELETPLASQSAHSSSPPPPPQQQQQQQTQEIPPQPQPQHTGEVTVLIGTKHVVILNRPPLSPASSQSFSAAPETFTAGHEFHALARSRRQGPEFRDHTASASPNNVYVETSFRFNFASNVIAVYAVEPEFPIRLHDGPGLTHSLRQHGSQAHHPSRTITVGPSLSSSPSFLFLRPLSIKRSSVNAAAPPPVFLTSQTSSSADHSTLMASVPQALRHPFGHISPSDNAYWTSASYGHYSTSHARLAGPQHAGSNLLFPAPYVEAPGTHHPAFALSSTPTPNAHLSIRATHHPPLLSGKNYPVGVPLITPDDFQLWGSQQGRRYQMPTALAQSPEPYDTWDRYYASTPTTAAALTQRVSSAPPYLNYATQDPAATTVGQSGVPTVSKENGPRHYVLPIGLPLHPLANTLSQEPKVTYRFHETMSGGGSKSNRYGGLSSPVPFTGYPIYSGSSPDESVFLPDANVDPSDNRIFNDENVYTDPLQDGGSTVFNPEERPLETTSLEKLYRPSRVTGLSTETRPTIPQHQGGLNQQFGPDSFSLKPLCTVWRFLKDCVRGLLLHRLERLHEGHRQQAAFVALVSTFLFCRISVRFLRRLLASPLPPLATSRRFHAHIRKSGVRPCSRPLCLDEVEPWIPPLACFLFWCFNHTNPFEERPKFSGDTKGLRVGIWKRLGHFDTWNRGAAYVFSWFRFLVSCGRTITTSRDSSSLTKPSAYRRTLMRNPLPSNRLGYPHHRASRRYCSLPNLPRHRSRSSSALSSFNLDASDNAISSASGNDSDHEEQRHPTFSPTGKQQPHPGSGNLTLQPLTETRPQLCFARPAPALDSTGRPSDTMQHSDKPMDYPTIPTTLPSTGLATLHLRWAPKGSAATTSDTFQMCSTQKVQNGSRFAAALNVNSESDLDYLRSSIAPPASMSLGRAVNTEKLEQEQYNQYTGHMDRRQESQQSEPSSVVATPASLKELLPLTTSQHGFGFIPSAVSRPLAGSSEVWSSGELLPHIQMRAASPSHTPIALLLPPVSPPRTSRRLSEGDLSRWFRDSEARGTNVWQHATSSSYSPFHDQDDNLPNGSTGPSSTSAVVARSSESRWRAATVAAAFLCSRRRLRVATEFAPPQTSALSPDFHQDIQSTQYQQKTDGKKETEEDEKKRHSMNRAQSDLTHLGALVEHKSRDAPPTSSTVFNPSTVRPSLSNATDGRSWPSSVLQPFQAPTLSSIPRDISGREFCSPLSNHDATISGQDTSAVKVTTEIRKVQPSSQQQFCAVCSPRAIQSSDGSASLVNNVIVGSYGSTDNDPSSDRQKRQRVETAPVPCSAGNSPPSGPLSFFDNVLEPYGGWSQIFKSIQRQPLPSHRLEGSLSFSISESHSGSLTQAAGQSVLPSSGVSLDRPPTRSSATDAKSPGERRLPSYGTQLGLSFHFKSPRTARSISHPELPPPLPRTDDYLSSTFPYLSLDANGSSLHRCGSKTERCLPGTPVEFQAVKGLGKAVVSPFYNSSEEPRPLNPSDSLSAPLLPFLRQQCSTHDNVNHLSVQDAPASMTVLRQRTTEGSAQPPPLRTDATTPAFSLRTHARRHTSIAAIRRSRSRRPVGSSPLLHVTGTTITAPQMEGQGIIGTPTSSISSPRWVKPLPLVRAVHHSGRGPPPFSPLLDHNPVPIPLTPPSASSRSSSPLALEKRHRDQPYHLDAQHSAHMGLSVCYRSPIAPHRPTTGTSSAVQVETTMRHSSAYGNQPFPSFERRISTAFGGPSSTAPAPPSPMTLTAAMIDPHQRGRDSDGALPFFNTAPRQPPPCSQHTLPNDSVQPSPSQAAPETSSPTAVWGPVKRSPYQPDTHPSDAVEPLSVAHRHHGLPMKLSNFTTSPTATASAVAPSRLQNQQPLPTHTGDSNPLALGVPPLRLGSLPSSSIDHPSTSIPDSSPQETATPVTTAAAVGATPKDSSPQSRIPIESVLAGFVDNGRFYRTFQDIRLIGKGGFGAVYRVKHRFEPDFPEYAVKFVTLRLKASENISSRRYFREVSANRDLFSRQVVRYFTWWCEEPQYLPHDHCPPSRPYYYDADATTYTRLQQRASPKRREKRGDKQRASVAMNSVDKRASKPSAGSTPVAELKKKKKKNSSKTKESRRGSTTIKRTTTTTHHPHGTLCRVTKQGGPSCLPLKRQASKLSALKGRKESSVEKIQGTRRCPRRHYPPTRGSRPKIVNHHRSMPFNSPKQTFQAPSHWVPFSDSSPSVASTVGSIVTPLSEPQGSIYTEDQEQTSFLESEGSASEKRNRSLSPTSKNLPPAAGVLLPHSRRLSSTRSDRRSSASRRRHPRQRHHRHPFEVSRPTTTSPKRYDKCSYALPDAFPAPFHVPPDWPRTKPWSNPQSLFGSNAPTSFPPDPLQSSSHPSSPERGGAKERGNTPVPRMRQSASFDPIASPQTPLTPRFEPNPQPQKQWHQGTLELQTSSSAISIDRPSSLRHTLPLDRHDDAHGFSEAPSFKNPGCPQTLNAPHLSRRLTAPISTLLPAVFVPKEIPSRRTNPCVYSPFRSTTTALGPSSLFTRDSGSPTGPRGTLRRDSSNNSSRQQCARRNLHGLTRTTLLPDISSPSVPPVDRSKANQPPPGVLLPTEHALPILNDKNSSSKIPKAFPPLPSASSLPDDDDDFIVFADSSQSPRSLIPKQSTAQDVLPVNTPHDGVTVPEGSSVVQFSNYSRKSRRQKSQRKAYLPSQPCSYHNLRRASNNKRDQDQEDHPSHRHQKPPTAGGGGGTIGGLHRQSSRFLLASKNTILKRRYVALDKKGLPKQRSNSDDEQRFPVVLLIQMELVSGMTLRQWLDRKERTTRVPDLVGAFRLAAGLRTLVTSSLQQPGTNDLLEKDDLCAQQNVFLDEPKPAKRLAQPVEVTLFQQLVKGLRDIHTHGIVHRDIKPENIFVNSDPLTLKIGDFGLARFIEAKTTIANAAAAAAAAAAASGGSSLKPPSGIHDDTLAAMTGGDTNQAVNSRESSLKQRRHPNGAAGQHPLQPQELKHLDSVVSVKGLVIGTPGYTAPEGGALCTEKADVFSASLILLELLCPRFETAMERYKTLEGFRTKQKIPEHITTYLGPWAELMKRMGASNPRDRPSADIIYRSIKKFRMNPTLAMTLPDGKSGGPSTTHPGGIPYTILDHTHNMSIGWTSTTAGGFPGAAFPSTAAFPPSTATPYTSRKFRGSGGETLRDSRNRCLDYGSALFTTEKSSSLRGPAYRSLKPATLQPSPNEENNNKIEDNKHSHPPASPNVPSLSCLNEKRVSPQSTSLYVRQKNSSFKPAVFSPLPSVLPDQPPAP